MNDFDALTARIAAAEAEWKENHPEALVTVRYSKFRVEFTKNRSWITVRVSVKGHWRRVVSCGTAEYLPKTGKSREAIARALFPMAA